MKKSFLKIYVEAYVVNPQREACGSESTKEVYPNRYNGCLFWTENFKKTNVIH